MKHDTDSLPPSWFVRSTRTYLQWAKVSLCPGCGFRGKYEDMHPVDPCPRCGNGSPVVCTGRWAVVRIEPVVWFGFLMPFSRDVWGWEILYASVPDEGMPDGTVSLGAIDEKALKDLLRL